MAPENGWLEDDPFLFRSLIFRCKTSVSGRVFQELIFPAQRAPGVCWAAFQVFDKDCSGTVTFDELEQVLNSAMMEGHEIS